ncbi:MAG: hypothetical protein M3478_15145 [Planctomycetota bacterium]|nr:hypothetical protein [Planctomycetota bacterium]
MSPQNRQAIRKEADLTERVVEYYRRLFAGLITRMNREPAVRSDIECMRMCVEAVDMMLENQGRMTKALRELTDDRDEAKKTAA